MADLSVMQVCSLRREIKKRYGKDIDKKIKKVVFVLPGNNIVSFEAEDDYKPLKQEEPPKPVYKVLIWERKLNEEPSEMRFKALDAAMLAFRNQQHLNFAKIVLMEDNTVLQVYEGRTYGKNI